MPLFKNGKRVRNSSKKSNKKSSKESNKKSSKAYALNPQNAGRYDVFWMYLLWEFIDDIKVLFIVRQIMKDTRYVKGNFCAQFPIGPYSYNQYLAMNQIPNPTAFVVVDVRAPVCASVSESQRQKNVHHFYNNNTVPTIIEKRNIGNGNIPQLFHANISEVVMSDSDDGIIQTTTSNPTPSDRLKLYINYDVTEEDRRKIGPFKVFHSIVVIDIEPGSYNDGYDLLELEVCTDVVHAKDFNLTINCQDAYFRLETNAVSLVVTGFKSDRCLFRTCSSVTSLTFESNCQSQSGIVDIVAHFAKFPNLVDIHLKQCFFHPEWNIEDFIQDFPNIHIHSETSDCPTIP